MLKRWRLAGIFAVLVLGGGFALGQSDDQPRILTEAEQAGFPAIGLVGYNASASSSICTGTLVSADLVLTAAHCVSEEGAVFEATSIYFFAGWRDGKSLAAVRSKAIVMAQGAEKKKWSMETDMALVVLENPIAASLATPIPLAPDAAVAGLADFISYRRDARAFAHLAKDCPVIDGDKPVIGLGCSVVTGNSGSPVLQPASDGWQIAGVIVSDGSGERGIKAYAVRPNDDIRSKIAQH